MENLRNLVEELIKTPRETAWVEFKHNNAKPETIGQNISALANAATFNEKNRAYLIWGVDDESHKIVGTTFNYSASKQGGEELESWLRHSLSENARFQFNMITIDNKSVVLLIIDKAISKTVMFNKVDFIKIGSYTKRLNDYPEVKAQLWDKLRNEKFENLPAKENLLGEDVLKYIDYSAYFDIKEEVMPTSPEGILHYLEEEGILIRQDNALFTITNMGAILFAKKIETFLNLARKAVRVIQYNGTSRINMLKEDIGTKGYASGFEGLIKYVSALLPANEVIKTALRETITEYPIIAIREVIANALIHQDFSMTGTGPVIEIFDNRIEITNPGRPLVDIARIIDNPPKSRNEKLAALMRRLRMCEELGTGWDKIVDSCEIFQLPAPKIEVYEENTKITLFSQREFNAMSSEDKLRACYMHACLKYVCGENISNTSLRERFGLGDTYQASISRLIKEAVAQDLIKAVDSMTAPRYMRYIPFWA